MWSLNFLIMSIACLSLKIGHATSSENSLSSPPPPPPLPNFDFAQKPLKLRKKMSFKSGTPSPSSSPSAMMDELSKKLSQRGRIESTNSTSSFDEEHRSTGEGKSRPGSPVHSWVHQTQHHAAHTLGRGRGDGSSTSSSRSSSPTFSKETPQLLVKEIETKIRSAKRKIEALEKEIQKLENEKTKIVNLTN